MGFAKYNPFPMSLGSECKKCAEILTSFINPRSALGPEKVIPPSILADAKGLAVISVFKAGFLGSGRFGSGVVVARTPSGGWSAPSCIAIGGGGLGGQIGAESTSFVFILNDASAVRSFSQAGSLTLGGNVSLAAGPVGRNAEAAGSASLKGVAGVFAYSKSYGLFAGVSLEGSVLVERRDANEKAYGNRYTAAQLTSGSVPPPPQAAPLMNVLNARVFSGMRHGSMSNDSMYNDVPVYDSYDSDIHAPGRSQTFDNNVRNDRTGSFYGGETRPSRSNTWRDDYDQSSGFGSGGGLSRANTVSASRNRMMTSDYTYSDNPAQSSPIKSQGTSFAPGRPSAVKPSFSPHQKIAIAKYKYGMETHGKPKAGAATSAEVGDLFFEKGDKIVITDDSDGGWWKGRHLDEPESNEGRPFPAVYVQLE